MVMRLALLMLLFVSCAIKENEFSEINGIVPTSIEVKNYKAFDFNQNDFIGVVSKWRVFKEGFVLLNNNSIFFYRDNIEQPLIINNESNFELEGCTISDFTIENGILYLLCEAKGVLISYNLEERKILSTIDLGVDATRFEVFNEQIIIYQTPNTLNQDSTLNFQIFLFPLSDPSSKRKYFNYNSSPDNSFQFNVLAGDSFFKYDNKIFFSRMQNDSVFVFPDKEHGFSIKNLNFSTTDIDIGKFPSNLENLVVYPLSLSIDEKYLFFSFLKNGKYLQSVSNMESNKSVVVEEIVLANDKVKVPLIAQIFEGSVYLLITDESLIEYNPDGEFDGLFKKLKNYEKSFIFISFPISELGL